MATALARSIWLSGTGASASWIVDVRFPAPQTEDTLDCALLEGELASKVLAALREQDLQELATEITPDWDLPTEAVQSGVERCAPTWSWCRATLPCCMK